MELSLGFALAKAVLSLSLSLSLCLAFAPSHPRPARLSGEISDRINVSPDERRNTL